jgi:hypothetical protein
MHSRTDLCLVTVLVTGLVTLVATALGCDEPYAETSDFRSDEPSAEATPKDDVPRPATSLEYEDAEDFAILNDRSNLRRSELSPLEHRRWLSLGFRDELVQDREGVEFPTEEEIALVSMRWFRTGTGIAIQNPTERPFTVSVYFSATAEPACGETVAMRAVAPGGSAVVSPRDSNDCVMDLADVSLTDEYGFLVNLITVEAEERKP